MIARVEPGMTIGRLTVKELVYTKKNKRGRTTKYWLCDCSCGTKDVIKPNGYLVDGVDGKGFPNCGCYNRERAKQHRNKREDLTGKTFDRLTVLGPGEPYISPKGSKTFRWKCQCKCGNIINVSTHELVHGRTHSCGCYKNERLHDYSKPRRMREVIDPVDETPTRRRLYGILHDMRQRCYNENNAMYQLYGGRGIYVCDEWNGKLKESTLKFEKWALENGYEDGLSIDRIDRNGPYAPWNCRWADLNTQNNNKRDNRYYWDGEEILTQEQFVRKYNLYSYKFIEYRLLHGWPWDAVVYAAKHPELGISYMKDKNFNTHIFKDKDGFMVLIPRLHIPPEIQEELELRKAERLELRKNRNRNWRYE